MQFAVRVTPKGGRDAIEGWTRDDAGRPVLKVRVAAAAAEGAARSAVTLVAGQTARVKRIEADVTEAELAAAFGPA